MKNINLRTTVSSAVIILTLSACGGGSGTTGSNGGSPATLLSGTAAAGAPLVGQVTIKGAQGNTKSALIEADGSYEVDVSGLTAPYRLRAEGTVGGRTYRMHSYAESGDVNGTVNITPFTDLIIANAAQQLASTFFDSSSDTQLDSTELEAQEDALQAKLQNVFDALGLDTAIDLLNESFSADHSGLDAALDIINVSVDENTHIATITNQIDNTFIADDLQDTEDNTDTIVVSDSAALTDAVSANQTIANVFEDLTSAFTNGLPDASAIQDYFTDDFYDEDMNRGLFLTDITTDPNLIGLTFGNVVISELDTVLGTAKATFHVGINGVMDNEPITWEARKDATLGWQLSGDQRIVDTEFSFHCNDYDGEGSWAGSCGINTRFWDNDFTNNGTVSDAPIASGKVSIFSSDGLTEKAVIYLGTPGSAAPGDVQTYNEANGEYQYDWKGFGTGTGEIDPSIFAEGDIIEYSAYTEDLDTSIQSSPAIALNAVAVATYTDTVLFEPATTGKYPSATTATQTAIDNFTLGNDLNIAWTLASGTTNEEVLIEVTDNSGNLLETWIDTVGNDNNSVTFASTQLDTAAATAAGLDANATSYNLLVRIYAQGEVTGQSHSRDYTTTIPGPAADNSSGSSLACDYESDWDDIADQPAGFNSFDDFESVVSDCGNALPITATDVEGTTWADSWTDSDGTWSETLVFNNGGTGTYTEKLDNVEQDNFNFTWSVSNSRLTISVAGQYLEILAILPNDQQKVYSEAYDWTPASDLTADSTPDGEIWTGSYVQQ